MYPYSCKAVSVARAFVSLSSILCVSLACSVNVRLWLLLSLRGLRKGTCPTGKLLCYGETKRGRSLILKLSGVLVDRLVLEILKDLPSFSNGSILNHFLCVAYMSHDYHVILLIQGLLIIRWEGLKAHYEEN